MEKNVNIIGRRFNGSSKRRAAANASFNISKRHASNLKRVTSLLRKKKASRRPLTEEEEEFLIANSELVKQFYKRREKRAEWVRRQKEHEDLPRELKEKCFRLAQAIHDAEFLLVYTGAGISTAASIPDYRGPNGIWTRLQKGKDIGNHDLTTAEPTYTHMALSYLHSKGIARHVVSQNCDGLHLRSGLPKTSISEVHGNMYIEVCKHCVPAREYVRAFDVTEKTSTFNHTTGRRCYRCGEPLVDTIVHFGERGRLRWPLNWQGACQAAKACDTILCLGSSLKVLRKYPWLWQMNRPPKRRPHLYIVNLQWTPKDKDATMKINGKCDDVMRLIMKNLGFEAPKYIKTEDPIFQISTALHANELATINRPLIEHPNSHSNAPTQNVVMRSKVGAQPQRLFTTSLIEENSAFDERLNSPSEATIINSNHKNIILGNLSPVIKRNNVTNSSKSGNIKDDKFKEETDGEDFEIKSEVPDTKADESCFKDVKKEDPEDSNTPLLEQLKSENNLDTKEEIKQEIKTEIKDEQKVKRFDDEDLVRRTNLHTSMSSSDSESPCSPKMEAGFSRRLSLPFLDSLKNKEINFKEINFYGTGLCIRSTNQPLDQISNDEEDCDDSSVSSLTSDTKFENVSEGKKADDDDDDDHNEICENMDFLFVSDDSSDVKVGTLESNNFYDQDKCTVITSLANCSYSVALSDTKNLVPHNPLRENENSDFNFLKVNAPFNAYDKEPSALMGEISISGSTLEASMFSGPNDVASPLGKEEAETILASEVTIPTETNIEVPFSVLLADSKYINCKRDGSYLLHTKIVDGIIHAADVKSLNDIDNEETLNGISNLSQKPFPQKDSHTEWCKKSSGRLKADRKKSPVKDRSKMPLELDDDVKRLWFWGFDTRPKEEEEEEPQRRLTRSSYQKALSHPIAVPGGIECDCLIANTELCRLSMPRLEAQPLEEEMVRAREAVRKRRQYNYRRFEPVFEVTLKSLTYERRKMRRSRREEEEEDEEELKVVVEGEGTEVVKKNGEMKVVPGWYGKGYKKILKKKKNSL